LFRNYWRRKSQGKPKISPETVALIEKLAGENQLWGAERILGELLKLGIEVSKRAIQKYMPKERGSRQVSRRSLPQIFQASGLRASVCCKV
jgi:hypothetical protein